MECRFYHLQFLCGMFYLRCLSFYKFPNAYAYTPDIQGLSYDRIQEINTLIFYEKMCCKVVLPCVESLVSLVNACDKTKDKIVVKQEVMTRHGWKRPHKGKSYKVWTYQDRVDVSNKHKFDASFMVMIRKLVRGTHT